MVPQGQVCTKFGDIVVGLASIFSDVVRLGVVETLVLVSRVDTIFKVLDLVSVLKFRVLVSASVTECLPHL